jgi:broad specificity phosphatase PhoE
MKPKRVFWIRHGESVANAGDHDAIDPVLTQLGYEQAEGVAAGLLKRFEKESDKKVKITLVISPLRRTVQTASHIFKQVARLPHVTVTGVINHDIREINTKPSGMGSETPVLFKIWEENMPADAKLMWDDEMQASWNAGEMTAADKINQSDRMAVAHDELMKQMDRVNGEWTESEQELVFAIGHWGIVNVYGNLFSKGWAWPIVKDNASVSTVAETPRGENTEAKFEVVEEVNYDQPRADIKMDPKRMNGPWLHVPEAEREFVRLLDLRNCELVAFDLE